MADVRDRESLMISDLEGKLEDYNLELDLIEGPERNRDSQ
jgi:hypothetical protein